ncbi:unnamed protein product [Moneuplotes crassus]|uniref:DUF924 domain-containing protein n=1 Tax=Euplotes crassus TaxID=5936 RepID=A0AAD1XTH1_EUPCR|nr:unnamed protein product [Moneuplotes crassus]
MEEETKRIHSRIQAVFRTWYEGIEDMETPPEEGRVNKWFLEDPEFDQEIRDAHVGDYDEIVADEGESWAKVPGGKMAVILVTDQFSRNMFRKTSKVFASDFIALKLAKEMLANGEYDELEFCKKIFCYVPLEHSEDVEDQAQCVKAVNDILENPGNEQQKRYAEYVLPYIEKHQEIIETFGRFPHRNEYLGRESTEEEIEFLKTCNRYGQ